MLPKVAISKHCCSTATDLENFRSLVGDELIDEIQELAKSLQKVRICHINSTATGGGVAELLTRYLPLLRALGLSADWQLIHGTPEFFTVTKSIHNALQGAAYEFEQPAQDIYLRANEQAARMVEADYDVFVVHDPQPAALRHFAGDHRARWIWRCHIDSSAPNAQVSQFLGPFIRDYDRLVFTMPEFLLPGLDGQKASFVAPAIDPFATKNMDIPFDLCRRTVADAGISLKAPLLVQVSRFDPWKDPLGVIAAYRLVKQQIPGVQLALIGAMAGDDPEGWELLARVQAEAANDPDLYVFTNLGGVGSMEVNVFQRACDVVIQKSLREGFGLVVAEALWKEKPVVAGRAGGIPMQFPEKFKNYLIDSVEQCAERILHLLQHAGERGEFGRVSRDHVRQHFLLPRLVRDELRLIKETIG